MHSIARQNNWEKNGCVVFIRCQESHIVATKTDIGAYIVLYITSYITPMKSYRITLYIIISLLWNHIVLTDNPSVEAVVLVVDIDVGETGGVALVTEWWRWRCLSPDWMTVAVESERLVQLILTVDDWVSWPRHVHCQTLLVCAFFTHTQ